LFPASSPAYGMRRGFFIVISRQVTKKKFLGFLKKLNKNCVVAELAVLLSLWQKVGNEG